MSYIDKSFKQLFDKISKIKFKGKKLIFLTIEDSYIVLLKILQDLLLDKTSQNSNDKPSNSLDELQFEDSPNHTYSLETQKIEVEFIEVFKNYCEIIKLLELKCTPQLTFISLLHLANNYGLILKQSAECN